MNFNIIIPIRSKSKGIKNKNIINFQKKINLTNFALKKLIGIKKIKKIHILTDSKLYKKKIIYHKKINKDYIRKSKHSLSNSKIQDLVNDFLKKNSSLDNLALIQVTSPLLNKKEIVNTFNFIKKNNIQSLMHVSEILENPHETICGIKNNWNFLIKKRITNRQNYKNNYFFITGSMFFFTKKFFKRYKNIYNNKSFAYKVDKINFVDIDDPFTLELSKKLLNMKIRN